MKSFLGVVLLFLVAVILTSGCSNDIEKVKLFSNKAIEPVESAHHIRVIYSDSAKTKLEIVAPELNRFQRPEHYVEMPAGFHAVFYGENLKVTSSLTAGYGIRHERDKTMEARKNVIVVNQKGDTLNTEHLIWDEKTEKLHTNEFVKITTRDEVIFGNGFEANQDFTRYKIFNIKGTISINSKNNDSVS